MNLKSKKWTKSKKKDGGIETERINSVPEGIVEIIHFGTKQNNRLDMELNDYKTMEDQTEAIELAIKTCLDYSGEESKSAREYLSQIMLNDSYLLDDYLYSLIIAV